MMWQRLFAGVLVVAGFLLARPAVAQYPVGDRAGRMSTGRTVYESRGPGYSTYFPAAEFAGRYDFYPGYAAATVVPSRFAASNGYYSTMPSGYTPTLMTSLNYPGIYGSYAYGLAAATANVATPFQTTIDNPPSDNPVGTPYAPLQRPLADVPIKRAIELSTAAPPLRPAPALVDVTLPSDAALYFQGIPMTETGGLRVFQSPPLEPGRPYTYDVRASWRTPEGEEVVRTRQLTVHAGERTEVDLTRAEMPRAGELRNEQRALQTKPLPEIRDRKPAPKD